jgi:hypothetical protein
MLYTHAMLQSVRLFFVHWYHIFINYNVQGLVQKQQITHGRKMQEMFIMAFVHCVLHVDKLCVYLVTFVIYACILSIVCYMLISCVFI